ncbi:pentapeptide repeat-containing protein [Streptomyces sp. 8N616]|uniref:pentapeptide repeat-containing protein n=1 Tax=Streptomyces sp. 8N616 TaxID=3457414 RepID=UPI003FD065CF
MKAKTKRIALPAVPALGIVGYALLLWRGPWWIDGAHLRTKNLQPADGVVITGFRTMLVALGAGAVAALGLHYTHRSHKQTEKLFEHTRERDREQAELTREGQVNERYVEAVKLLSSNNVTQRIGGIYSLERIMRDSEKDHSTVVEVLAAFIRQMASPEASEPTRDEPPADIQAALTVLGRRPGLGRDEPRIDLRGADLRGADLSYARLNGALLSECWLDEAIAFVADLRDTVLIGASMRGTLVVEGKLSAANLERANLHGATLNTACEGIRLHDADLRDTTLINASGLTARQVVQAKLYSSTVLPPDLRMIQEVQKRIEECEASEEGAQR